MSDINSCITTMLTPTVNLQQDQLDIIQVVCSLEDHEIVRKIKNYIHRLTKTHPDPLYSPKNIADIKKAYKECKSGKSTRMTKEELHEFLWS